MSLTNVNLEPSEGPTIPNPSVEEVRSVLERIGGELDHCILHLGSEDEFLQAAGTPGRLLVQYRDARGMHESERSDLDVALVTRIFGDAMAGRTAWKTEVTFRPMGSPAHGGTTSRRPAEDLLDAAKRAAKEGLRKAMRGGLRGLFGGK